MATKRQTSKSVNPAWKGMYSNRRRRQTDRQKETEEARRRDRGRKRAEVEIAGREKDREKHEGRRDSQEEKRDSEIEKTGEAAKEWGTQGGGEERLREMTGTKKDRVRQIKRKKQRDRQTHSREGSNDLAKAPFSKHHQEVEVGELHPVSIAIIVQLGYRRVCLLCDRCYFSSLEGKHIQRHKNLHPTASI